MLPKTMHGKQPGFWWKSNGINEMVDNGSTLKQISNAVNRGPGNKNSNLNPNGWEDRQNAYKLVNKVMKQILSNSVSYFNGAFL